VKGLEDMIGEELRGLGRALLRGAARGAGEAGRAQTGGAMPTTRAVLSLADRASGRTLSGGALVGMRLLAREITREEAVRELEHLGARSGEEQLRAMLELLQAHDGHDRGPR
jgi:hypothetical protein